jgi:hypothetical protein
MLGFNFVTVTTRTLINIIHNPYIIKHALVCTCTLLLELVLQFVLFCLLIVASR